MFGHGWLFTYGIKLIEVTDGRDDHVVVRRANGQRDRFRRLGEQLIAPADVFETLTKNAFDGTFQLVDREGVQMDFDAAGNLTIWTDPKGNSLALAYDSAGFLTSVTDDSGRALELTKGANGKVAAVIDPAGRLMSYQYDVDGNLIRVTDPAAGVTEYSYDSQGNITAIQDPRGNVITSVTYDSVGRVRTYTEMGETYTLDHQPSQKRVIETDSQGNTRVLVYNDNINIVSRTDRSGKTETTTFDGNFNVTGIIDRNGNSTTYTFDAAGNRTSLTDPAGATTMFDYEPTFNSLTAITDPLGNVTTFEYDSQGNLIKTTDAPGNVTQSTYDSRGLLSSTTDSNGFTRTFAYDSHGYLVSETDSLGRVTTSAHDVLGNLTATTDPDGRTSQLRYDSLNRLVELQDSDGNITRFEYAPRCLGCERPDLLTAIVESDGSRTSFEHDPFGRIVRVTDALGNAYQATYDSRGNLLTVTNARGETTSYTYDSLDRITQVARPGGVVTGYTYDANGNVTQIVDPGGLTTTYVYDALDRFRTTTSSDAGTVQYSYDAAGRRAGKIDARGVNVTYEYDSLGRRTAIRFPDGSEDVSFRYDEASVANGSGRLTGMADPSGDTSLSYDPLGRLEDLTVTRSGVIYVTSYEYSLTGAVQKLTYPSGLEITYGLDTGGFVSSVAAQIGGGVGQILASSINYDSDGNRVSTALGNGVTEIRIYDGNDRVTEIASAGLQHLQYEYDTVGNVLAVSDLVDPSRNQTYGYDALDRLTSASGPWGSIGYAYDATGNRTQRTRGAELLNYTYDANRLDMISGSRTADYAFDAAGNTTFDGTFDFEYAQNGRLSRVLENGSEIARYTHDGFGQRVIKEVGGTRIVFHYDNRKRLIEETSPDGTSIRAYVYLPDGIPLAMIQGGNTYFYHPDRFGTPLKLSDAAGSEVWRADPTPFGDAAVAPGGIEQPLRLLGQYFDRETGLHYNYHREYDPEIGRYLQADPLGLDAGINLYVYAGNNPLRYTDPNGLLSLFEAVKHYFFGKGKTVKVPFGDVDLGLKPSDFPGFATAVKSLYKKKATKSVNLTVSRDVGDLVFGHVTFRLTGTITSDKCKWTFKGKVDALNDSFDFNALPWGTRKKWKEVITRIFGTLPGGTPFDIQFTGSRKVSDGGKW